MRATVVIVAILEMAPGDYTPFVDSLHESHGFILWDFSSEGG